MTIVDPKHYQALVLAKALRLYAHHGIMVNRTYTPKNMMRTAESLTGQQFKSRDYRGAAAALDAWRELGQQRQTED